MPRGDRTGPEGQGPLTGRQMGTCAGNDVPGYAESGPGIGLGRGYGRGWAGRGRRGYRNWFRATGAPRWGRFAPPAWGPMPPEAAAEMEQADLKAQASWLRSQLDAIQARLDALGSGEEGEA